MIKEVHVHAVATVELEVRELIRRRAIDPMQDVLAARKVVQEAVADYDERAMSGSLPPLPDVDEAVKAITDAVAGFGKLQKYFDDPSVEEIWVNEPDPGYGSRRADRDAGDRIVTKYPLRVMLGCRVFRLSCEPC